MKFSYFKISLTLALIFIFASLLFAQTGRESGIELYKKGDYKGAIKLLKQATKIDADDASAWYYLGLSYFKTDKLKEAEKALKTVIKIKPDDSQGYIGMAYLQLSANKGYEAQTSSQKALELNEQNSEAHYIVGLINFRNGSFSGAYERAEKAIKIDPNFADAYLLKSEALTSSFGQIRGTVTKSPAETVELLKESVMNIEKYLTFSTNTEDRKIQQERLESLKFFANHYSKPENQAPNNLEINPAAAGNSTPVKITSKSYPAYTASARAAGLSGTVRLLVGFSENGKVKYILVLKGLGFGLNEQATKAAQAIEFEPATRDGKPISVVKQIEYSFLLY